MPPHARTKRRPDAPPMLRRRRRPDPALKRRPPPLPHPQGYGLTETCAATFVSAPDSPSNFYAVGAPQPAFSLRLEAVPDMDYDP